MSYTEKTPLEQGFAAVFEDKVLPKLHEVELERQAMVNETRKKLALLAAGCVVVMGLGWLIGDDFGFLIMGGAPVLAAFIGIRMRVDAGERWKARLANSVMPHVCDHVGDMRFTASGAGFPIKPFLDLRLVERHQKAELNSLLSGTHAGMGFSIVHARLTSQRANSNDDTTYTTQHFNGLLFRIDLGQPAPGRIALMRDRGAAGNKLAEAFSSGGPRSLPKLDFDDADFEEMFETYADEPDAARDFMTDARRASLVKIGTEHGRLLAGFDGQYFYMALERPGGFILIGNFREAADALEYSLNRVFHDIATVQEVIADLAEPSNTAV